MSVNDSIATRDDAEIDLGALWRIAWDRRYFIIGFTAVCSLIAVAVALITVPIFRAEVVVVEASNEGMSGGASLANQLGGLANLVGVNIGPGGDEGRESMALLKSRRLVEAFITRYQLMPTLFKKAKRPPTLWRSVERFREGMLSIREDKRSGTITVVLDWTDPEAAAHWANDFVALANELRRTQVIEESKRNIAYLNAEIAKTNVVELQHVMYNIVEAETKKLMLANVRADYAFAVMDPAVAPEQRISPKRTLMVLFGTFLGGIAATLLALAHDRYRRYRRGIKASA